jgi:hypothetical protein
VAVSTPATVVAPRLTLNAASTASGVVLPRTLDPGIDDRFGEDGRNGSLRAMRSLSGPVRARVGTPDPIVRSCHAALLTAARPYGALEVDAVSGGRTAPAPSGGLLAPINARVTYSSGRSSRVRQASIVCQLDSMGQVVSLR